VFLNKVEAITPEATKNQIWENNHITITCAISSLIKEFGRMPTRTEISLKSELSRQTVHKHLKDYANNDLYLSQMDQFKTMASVVLS
jgi:DNA-directed RNA polymerase specialized sigma subunit